jgi:hypothetical protein
MFATLLWDGRAATFARVTSQYAIACLAENTIGILLSVDLRTALEYCEQCCNCSFAGAVCFDWRLQTGRSIPVAAEYFKKVVDSNNPSGTNCLGCLESGKGIVRDLFAFLFISGSKIVSAVRRKGKRRRRKQFWNLCGAGGGNNFSFCLERGRGVA